MACEAGGNSPSPPSPGPTKVKPDWTATAIPGLELSYLPADSDLVLRVDVATLRQSKLWATYETDIARALLPNVECEFSPIRDVSTVEIGITAKAGLDVFVVRGIDRDKLLKCLHQRAAAQFEGDIATVSRPSGSSDMLTFVDATTMIMQEGKTPTKETFARVLQIKGAPLRNDQAFMAALKRLPVKAPFALVTRPNSTEMQSKWKQMGMTFEFLYGSMDLTPEPVRLETHVAMVLGSADEAKQLTETVKTQLKSPQVTAMFERLDVASQGDTMTMEISLSEPKLAALVGMLRSMLPR